MTRILKNFIPLFAVVIFLAGVAGQVWAAAPTVVLSVRSIDELLDDADFVGAAAGQEGIRQLAESNLEQMTGGLGLAGVDRDRALGLYWNMDESAPEGAGTLTVFIPMADEDAFRGLIEKFLPEVKNEDGRLSISLNGQDFYAVFQDDYCFLSNAVEGIEEPQNPEEIVNAENDIALTVNIASIPKSLRDNYLQVVEQSARSSMDNDSKPESEAEEIGRQVGLNWVLYTLSEITNDGDQLSFGIDINSEDRTVAFDLSVSAVEKTQLASAFAAYAKMSPAFGAVSSDDAPLRLVLSHPTTAILKDLDTIFGAIRKSAESEIDKDPKMKDDEDRKAAKDIANRLLTIGELTLKSGSLHSVVVVEEGDDETVRVVAGTKIAKGADAGKLLDDILVLSKESPELAKVKPDVAKHAGARIHEIDGDTDEKTKAMFGEGPAHLAIRPDSLWLSIGGGNLDALKQMLDVSGKKSPAGQAPISLHIKPATLVQLMEKENQALIERAESIAGESGDLLELVVIPQDQTGIKVQLRLGVDLFKLSGN